MNMRRWSDEFEGIGCTLVEAHWRREGPVWRFGLQVQHRSTNLSLSLVCTASVEVVQTTSFDLLEAVEQQAKHQIIHEVKQTPAYVLEYGL